MINTHLILPIKLMSVLVICSLVSCKTEPQTWPNCALAEEFTVEYAEGDGFGTAVEALAAYNETQSLPGTAMLVNQEADRVTWNIYDGERWIGEISAVTDATESWHVISGSWCVDE